MQGVTDTICFGSQFSIWLNSVCVHQHTKIGFLKYASKRIFKCFLPILPCISLWIPSMTAHCRKVSNSCWKQSRSLEFWELNFSVTSTSVLVNLSAIDCKSIIYTDVNTNQITRQMLVYLSQNFSHFISLMGNKFVWLLSANHRCVLWPVAQWECSIFITLNLWAFRSKYPWIFQPRKIYIGSLTS